jgi:hypothetical protein
MDMILELVREGWAVVVSSAEFLMPADPRLQGLVAGLLAVPAYKLLRKVPLIKSVIGLGERAVQKAWSLTGGKLISLVKAGAAKLRGRIDGSLK